MIDEVNSPARYMQGGIETIDCIESCVAGKDPVEAVMVANVVKYVSRYNKKNGVEDLRKACWYLERLIGKVCE